MESHDNIPSSSGIYRITCKANNKIYIGSARKLDMRWRDHQAFLRTDRHHNKPMQNSYNKYGAAAFIFEVLELCFEDELVDKEQFWLDAFKPFSDNNGFNILKIAHSSRGYKHTEETRKILSDAAKKRTSTPEQRAEIIQRIRNVPRTTWALPLWTEQRKRQASISRKGRTACNKGIAQSEETKKKISETFQKLKINVKYSDELRQEVYNLRQQGKTFIMIGVKTGISLSQCHKIYNAMCLELEGTSK